MDEEVKPAEFLRVSICLPALHAERGLLQQATRPNRVSSWSYCTKHSTGRCSLDMYCRLCLLGSHGPMLSRERGSRHTGLQTAPSKPPELLAAMALFGAFYYERAAGALHDALDRSHNDTSPRRSHACGKRQSEPHRRATTPRTLGTTRTLGFAHLGAL